MLRNLGIRWQILSALALPVLVLGLISSQVTYQALVDMREANQSRELAQAAGGFADLVGGLQAERALSVAVVLGQPEAEARLTAVRSAVDEGLAATRTAVYGDSTGEDIQQVLARSAAAHGKLPALRADVDAGELDPRAVVAAYSEVIATDVAVPSDLASTFQSQDATANFLQFAELSQVAEALAQEQLVGSSIILTGKATLADQRQLGATVTAGQQALTTFNRTAGTEQQAALTAALATVDARSEDLATARAAFLAAGTSQRPAIALADWTAITTGQLAALRSTQDAINQEGISLATAQYDADKRRLQLTLGGAIGITLLTLALALALSRRISAPLRRLTQAATQIRDELPRIVESAQTDEDFELELPVVQVVGRNEVSRLAAAFVDVNAVTVAIAREQAQLRAAVADMFVNVARRNQVLLSRQLSLIDQLERNEVNPDALEELFRLDHLATRMRRNAESLLVLAGIESGRRLRDPMPLSDVVRTATSEIEHYSRVSLSLDVDPPVFAHLALPIAHLLAELLENATNFSDPGSTVIVMASATEQGIRMTVADDGLGIPAEELLEINARIDQPPTADALSSQRLGFFVVGRLAQRLDAKVTLTSGRARGTAVLIDLPSSLFVPGSFDQSMYDRPGIESQPATPALPGVPEQGRAPVRTPEPVGAQAAGSPFVGAFDSAGTTSRAPQAPQALPIAMAPVTLPPVPAAFNSAAFDAVNALEPVWSPQPDNLPFGTEAAPITSPLASPGLPARRGAVPMTTPVASAPVAQAAPAAPISVPQMLPRPTTESFAPAAEPVRDAAPAPSAPSDQTAQTAQAAQAAPSVPSARAAEPDAPRPNADPQITSSTETTPEWAESDWAVSEWTTPTEEASTGAGEFAESAAPQAAPTGPSIFSGFRTRQAAAEPSPDLQPATDLQPAADPIPAAPAPEPAQAPTAPIAFLDSAVAVDEWFDAGPKPEPDHWQTWDEVAAPAPSGQTLSDSAPTSVSWNDDVTEDPAEPTSGGFEDPAPTAVRADPIAVTWAPELAGETSLPAPELPTPEPVRPQHAAESWSSEADAPEVSWATDPAPAPEAWAPAPTPEVWTPEPAAATWAPVPTAPEAWSPEPAAVPEAWSPEPAAVPEAWSPEPAAVPEAWTPEPAAVPEAWTPEPAPAAWSPEPASVPEVWTPEPAAAAWAPEAATQSWAPELAGPAPEQPATWAPEQPTPEQPQQWTPEPEAWTSEPAQDWTSESAPAAEPETAPRAGATTDPLKQTLTAAIDILPQRTTIRTALRRGRRKGDPQPAGSLPFNGGFDPIAPAREFARREGFGSTPEVSGALPAEVTGTPATSGPVPEPSRSRDSVPVPVERRQHPRPGDQDGQEGRSALASEALTELSRLSSYSPTSMPTEQRAGLQRRTPSEVPVEEPQPAVESGGQRARTAASVRSMLAGFKAGVERGRTSPSANRPALTTLPRQPRNSSTEDS